MQFKNYFLLFLLLQTSLSFSQSFDGYALYNELNNNTSYLIDANGNIAHTWTSSRPCNYSVLLKENGNIVRGAVNQGNAINGAAVGGLIQEIDPDGNVVWSFTYSSADYVSHHDISLMPDGNVLLTAWEVKDLTELRSMGYSGNSNVKYPTHFVEVAQDGIGGKIVWEWHMWDHMIQDVDPNKPNYGVIADHPELMDINVQTSSSGGGPGGGGGDWFHVNGVDYNNELDQITFSSRFLSEVFIIDHSTTAAEAAGHSGGNAGKGGDFLFRWGNPSNHGVSGTRKIAGAVHDARWIPDDGRPRGGYLQFFNNIGTGSRSTVDAIELPRSTDGYNYDWTPGQEYGPASADFRHVCLSNASGQSAANSMPDGNVYVNLSKAYMYEVDSDGNTVWQYAAGPAKGFRYTCDHPGIQVLISLGKITGNLCATSGLENTTGQDKIALFPNPTKGIFSIEGLATIESIKEIQIFNLYGQKIQNLPAVSSIDLSDQMPGTYLVSFRLSNNTLITKKIAVIE